MKKYKLIVLLVYSLISPIVLAQQELTPYMEMAAANNPGLKAKFNEYLAALEQVPQVKSLPDPQISFAYFISPVETRVGPQQFKISASQFFPWFGSLEARENAAVQAAKARYELFCEIRSNLFHEVRSVYYNLYFIQKSIGITGSNIDLLRSIQKLVTIKVESGLVSMLDEYRVEMEIQELENQLALLKDEMAALQQAFRNLLNAEDDLVIELPEELWNINFPLAKEAASDSVLSANHGLLQLGFKQSALVHKRELAEKQGKPDFMVGLDYTVIGKGENNLAGKDAFIFPAVGISIPLYRDKYKAMVREVSYLETANQEESSDLENKLETLFEKTWKEYMDADRRILLNESQVELASKALNLLESEYSTGNTNFEEILRMERKVLQFRLAYEKARADKQAAISFLNYLMGK